MTVWVYSYASRNSKGQQICTAVSRKHPLLILKEDRAEGVDFEIVWYKRLDEYDWELPHERGDPLWDYVKEALENEGEFA